MFKALKKFTNDEAGAVTVDWVVLTAAVVGLCIALVLELQGGAAGVTERTEGYLVDYEVGAATE